MRFYFHLPFASSHKSLALRSVPYGHFKILQVSIVNCKLLVLYLHYDSLLIWRYFFPLRFRGVFRVNAFRGRV